MFWTQLKLAIRNVFRNKRRTSITLASIVIGGIAIILVGGYIEYSFWGLREMAIRSELGHIQIYKDGFIKNGQVEPQKYLLDSAQVQSIKNELSKNDSVKTFSQRLSIVGLVSDGNKNLFFMGQGIEPEKESEISSTLKIVDGTDLFDDDSYKILVGKGLAENLKLSVGNQLTLMVSTFYGGINAMDFEIAGIISNGIKEFDDKIIRLKLNEAQELLGTDKVERVITLLNETEETDTAYSLLDKSLAPQGTELRKWDSMADYYQKVKTVYQNIFAFLKTIILIVIVLSIMNTMMMSVMERVSEIGTLRSLGTSRSGILLLFINEGLVLGVVGGVLAIILGIGCAFLINLMGGIYMPPPPGHTTGYVILIQIVPSALRFTFLLSIVSAILSSIFPAIKAARLKVVDAIRHV